MGKSVRSLSCRSFRFQGISSFVFGIKSQILFRLKMHGVFITVCAAFCNSVNRREIPFFIIIDEDKILFLQFYPSSGWKNFPEISFWLQTFQHCFSSAPHKRTADAGHVGHFNSTLHVFLSPSSLRTGTGRQRVHVICSAPFGLMSRSPC